MTVLDFDGIPFDALATSRAPEPAATAPASPAPASAPAGRADTVSTAAGGHSATAMGSGSAIAAGGHSATAVGGDSATAAGRDSATAAGRESVALVHREAAAAAHGTTPAAVAHVATESDGVRVRAAIGEIRAGVVAAHRATLAAQVAVQRAILRRAALIPVEQVYSPTIAPAPEPAFKPPARTPVTRLDAAALRRLTEGDIAGVFGPAHRRGSAPAAARLASAAPLALTEVELIELRGGDGNGRLVAGFHGDPRAAAVQAAEVFALYTGLHLCLSHGDLVAAAGEAGAPSVGSGTLELLVDRIDLVPRPHVTGVVRVAGAAIEVSVAVAEPAGSSVGPGEAANGLLLNEFHMVHLSRGDQVIAMGPEFAEYTGVRATRLPTGGLLLVDRVIDFDGARGDLDSASYTSEYDSPADSWYYADTANESMPHFVYMETSLQAALLMGYYAGPTLTQPGTTLSLRNLGGKATVLRQVDLRDKTIEQSSRLLSTTILPGSSLQTFDYTLSVDGEPFYAGETMFGYFSDQALANQTGLDAGRAKPSWLAEHPDATVREIDVAARRADPAAPLCARRNLTLIDRVAVVDGGGEYGAGYLHSLRTIDPTDWYFARHFHLDPVIPGSLGVESVIHAVQEWMIDAGFAATMADPVFRIPRDVAFSWRYRGQFLPSDGTVELEAHVKSVRRGPDGVVVTVDGSLWKPGLRIYELLDLGIELVDRKASR